ncbi:leucyl aminopeptidase [Actinomyces gaoshouyii]|uniref:Probable cytosol aminopeptidase n=1 Tax=Actinomyces gaoshouyii TaxID=1960083 RepID=A0A8H9HBD8_9ACTO|nr:leucyl aminopeptidase [Actinomyces gaoshouyii]ARD41606.1 leucyl aminopeptidase [Actinomyces gaoshouyii]GGO98136.1 putative cytosol aminopeptidase [Actinomyces gaoshouyii]
MSTLEIIQAPAARIDADVLVLAAAPPSDGGATGILRTGACLEGIDVSAVEAALPSLGFSGSLDAVVRIPSAIAAPADRAISARTILVVGTGRGLALAESADHDAAALGLTRASVLSRAAGRAARELAGVERAVLALPSTEAADLTAVAEGAMTGAYAWRGRVPAPTEPLAAITISSPLAGGARAEEARTRAVTLGEAVALTRDLVNEPPNRLVPEALAERAASAARSAGIGVDALDERELAEQGFGGILAVGQGAANPPRLVRLEWAPSGARAHVALVGKGITFDSGGLSLKPPASMPEMKSDMAGAATVLGAVLAAARLELPVRVTAWLALAENMPGPCAQRPSDIITMRGGTTVEVTNTDAEGRLVMADALARAVEDSPDAVLDVATLTGAQIVALGDHVSGVMGTPTVRDAVARAAAGAGESFWPMPLPEQLRPGLDSPYAALRNAVVGSRAGGMLTAGLFLREFVGSTPWAHLDIAGPAFNERAPWGATPTGGTGHGVATLLAYLRAASK